MLGLGQLTPTSGCVVPECPGLQVFPPSDVLRMIPSVPTATQWWASEQLTSSSLADAPLFWMVHRPGGAEAWVGAAAEARVGGAGDAPVDG